MASEYKKFLASIGGDLPLASIVKVHIRTYRDDMRTKRGLKNPTVSKHGSLLSGLFRWAMRESHVPDTFQNPVTALMPTAKQNESERKKIRRMTDAEILTLFSAPAFLTERTAHPERYWVSLICLFRACRRNEVGQLLIQDVGELEAIPYLYIKDEGAAQGLKCAASKRKVPIHPSLLTLGFLKYVAKQKASRKVRLFSQLREKVSGCTDCLGHWFAAHMDSCGLSGSDIVMHSLRRSGITKLHAAGVSESHAMILAGHESKTVHGKDYVDREGIGLPLLLEDLSKLRYDEVVKGLLAKAG